MVYDNHGSAVMIAFFFKSSYVNVYREILFYIMTSVFLIIYILSVEGVISAA